ncbi:hypothetical protein PAEPH01_2464 [Pancytospora epiphaga]|nr:hypothetical protein PAEPH01_2464 [Pancytospora epiphaga]
MEENVETEIKRPLDLGYIRILNSFWCNKVKPVKPPNGNIRLTTNLISLNQHVPLNKYSLPMTKEMLHRLCNAKYFTKLELKEGFSQIKLEEEDRHKTAFKIKNRFYGLTRMPMDFKNAPAIFQRLLDIVLRDEIGETCYAYVDNILVFERTQEELQEKTKKIINKLVEAGLRNNSGKCEFNKGEVKF